MPVIVHLPEADTASIPSGSGNTILTTALKDIDWKAYARTEKLYVRQFEEEKTLTTHILLDASKSMDYPEKGTSKFEYAAMLAAGYAYMVTKYNDRFAISTFTQEIDITKPSRETKKPFTGN